MFANKSVLMSFLVWGLIVARCSPTIQPVEQTPTIKPHPAPVSIQPDPTSTMFIGIPPISDPLIQADNESVEEFVARIIARDISYSHPVLIALTQVRSKERLSEGIALNLWDIQRCWFYTIDSDRECTSVDLETYNDENIAKIFFAFACSDSVESLFLVEYFYEGDDPYPTDYYRLILELKEGKWIEKSILPSFW